MPVLPCNPSAGQERNAHVTPRGFKDASTAEEVVLRYWRRFPAALIGMPVGTATGLVVVDLDHRQERISQNLRFGRSYGTAWADDVFRNTKGNVLESDDPSGGADGFLTLPELARLGFVLPLSPLHILTPGGGTHVFL